MSMIPEELHQANDEQMSFFFEGYEFTWRLTKILSFKMLLENKQEFGAYLASFYGKKINIDNDYINYPVNNGLVYSALVELAMHIEDLFALIKFIRADTDFAKKIAWYRASEITGKFANTLKSELKDSPNKILNRLLIPDREYIQMCIKQNAFFEVEAPNIEYYDLGTSVVLSYFKEIINLYEKIKSPYAQYKHGLKIRLKDVKTDTNSSPESSKNIQGTILSLHNDTWEDGIENGRIQPGVMAIPFSDFMNQNSRELMSSKNLFQYAPALFINIDYIVDLAQKTTELILNLVRNRMDYIHHNLPEHRTIYLPYQENGHDLYYFHLGKVDGKLLGLADFKSMLRV